MRPLHRAWTEERTQHPATVKFGQVVVNALASTGQNAQPAHSIKHWLMEAGAVNVLETVMDCPAGARATSPELRNVTTKNMLGIV
jgi:uncharacterized protein (DUF3084 family)